MKQDKLDMREYHITLRDAADRIGRRYFKKEWNLTYWDKVSSSCSHAIYRDEPIDLYVEPSKLNIEQSRKSIVLYVRRLLLKIIVECRIDVKHTDMFGEYVSVPEQEICGPHVIFDLQNSKYGYGGELSEELLIDYEENFLNEVPLNPDRPPKPDIVYSDLLVYGPSLEEFLKRLSFRKGKKPTYDWDSLTFFAWETAYHSLEIPTQKVLVKDIINKASTLGYLDIDVAKIYDLARAVLSSVEKKSIGEYRSSTLR